MKISPVGAELFHADRHDEASSRFSQLCEHTPKKFKETVSVFLNRFSKRSSRGLPSLRKWVIGRRRFKATVIDHSLPYGAAEVRNG
jgi:hypothetical protein